MVTRKNIKSHALVSVYDKSYLRTICLVFKKYNIGIISTGSTAKKIKSLGFKTVPQIFYSDGKHFGDYLKLESNYV